MKVERMMEIETNDIHVNDRIHVGKYTATCQSTEHEITIEKLLNVVHSYTNPIRIHVLIGDAWLTCEEARGTRRLHDFYLTKAYTEYDDEEKERLLKYYKDVPVWNITAWHDVLPREIRYGIEAQCYYKDLREGHLAEKADLKRAKERERRKKKRGADDETGSPDRIS